MKFFIDAQAMRQCFLAVYAVGPMVALRTLRCRGLGTSTATDRVPGWRRHIPSVLLPIEWLLPPVLIVLELGEIQAGWLPARLAGLALSLGGAVLLIWASVVLGRFLVHEAAIFQDHALITSGPYRLVRHPIYSGYLALLLGSGLGMLNVWILLIWPFSLLGIHLQAAAEERLLLSKFGQAYRRYAGRTGRLLPRFATGSPGG